MSQTPLKQARRYMHEVTIFEAFQGLRLQLSGVYIPQDMFKNVLQSQLHDLMGSKFRM